MTGKKQGEGYYERLCEREEEQSKEQLRKSLRWWRGWRNRGRKDLRAEDRDQASASWSWWWWWWSRSRKSNISCKETAGKKERLLQSIHTLGWSWTGTSTLTRNRMAFPLCTSRKLFDEEQELETSIQGVYKTRPFIVLSEMIPEDGEREEDDAFAIIDDEDDDAVEIEDGCCCCWCFFEDIDNEDEGIESEGEENMRDSCKAWMAWRAAWWWWATEWAAREEEWPDLKEGSKWCWGTWCPTAAAGGNDSLEEGWGWSQDEEVPGESLLWPLRLGCWFVDDCSIICNCLATEAVRQAVVPDTKADPKGWWRAGGWWWTGVKAWLAWERDAREAWGEGWGVINKSIVSTFCLLLITEGCKVFNASGCCVWKCRPRYPRCLSSKVLMIMENQAEGEGRAGVFDEECDS